MTTVLVYVVSRKKYAPVWTEKVWTWDRNRLGRRSGRENRHLNNKLNKFIRKIQTNDSKAYDDQPQRNGMIDFDLLILRSA